MAHAFDLDSVAALTMDPVIDALVAAAAAHVAFTTDGTVPGWTEQHARSLSMRGPPPGRVLRGRARACTVAVQAPRCPDRGRLPGIGVSAQSFSRQEITFFRRNSERTCARDGFRQSLRRGRRGDGLGIGRASRATVSRPASFAGGTRDVRSGPPNAGRCGAPTDREGSCRNSRRARVAVNTRVRGPDDPAHRRTGTAAAARGDPHGAGRVERLGPEISPWMRHTSSPGRPRSGQARRRRRGSRGPASLSALSCGTARDRLAALQAVPGLAIELAGR